MDNIVAGSELPESVADKITSTDVSRACFPGKDVLGDYFMWTISIIDYRPVVIVGCVLLN